MSTDYKFLKVEVNNDICILTLDRESKLNALNAEVIQELTNFFLSTEDEKYSGIIFTGAGEKAFIAGADIAAMKDMSEQEAHKFSSAGQKLTLIMESIKIPIICTVDGFALGGGLEMAMACDFIYATDKSKFGLPETSLGLIPGFGGTQRLAKLIGRARAKEMGYTGKLISAELAKNYGLVLDLFPTKLELMEHANKTISSISKNSPHAVGIFKSVLNRGVDGDNTSGLEVEAESFGKIFTSEDMKEGVGAFMEKRKANFLGK